MSEPMSVAFVGSSDQLVTGDSRQTVRVWDASTGTLREVLDARNPALFSFSLELTGYVRSTCGSEVQTERGS